MKTTVKTNLVLATLLLLTPLGLFAQTEPTVKMAPVMVSPGKTPEQAYLATFAPNPAVPYPVIVRTPALSNVDFGNFFGRTVEVEFLVGADGSASKFKTISSPDARLANRIIDTLKDWRFSPAHHGDEAVAMRASLQIRIGGAK